MEKFRVIGVMSGTSMDGVDLAYCVFRKEGEAWSYNILNAETVPYEEIWRVRLSQLYKQPIEIFPKSNAFYGKYLGKLVKDFIKKHNIEVDLISSHGHTIFHQPEGGFTSQIGDGAAISAICDLPVVCDFRSLDVALNGQGAPLVPVGDKYLFGEFDACLNLGGIANITFLNNIDIIAYDISPCNIVFNRIARWMKQKFDDGGRIAQEAEVDPGLLAELNNLEYYSKSGAKSMGREWINKEFWPIIKKYQDTSEAEKMATLSDHISTQIASEINKQDAKRILVTGGGAFNSFLIDGIKKKSSADLIVPDETTVNYKEALIFAFLGVLRVKNQLNCLNTVTGARKSSVSGALYGDFSILIK